MFLGKIRNRLANRRLSLREKLTLSLSAIAVVLVVSAVILWMQYRSMSSYVSGLIADNINSINVAQKLSEVTNTYNLDILSVIGDESARLPNFNQEEFVTRCDSLKKNLTSVNLLPLADSVMYSYSAYMLTTLELEDVLLSDFIDSRTWYFDRLQPKYNRLRGDIDKLSAGMYDDLKKNSLTFDRGYFRSVMPGFGAIAVGVLLIILLLFFILAYYVNPIYKMLDALDNYRSYNKKYTYTFEGDDQLADLNSGISEMAAENHQLRKRLSALRNSTMELNGNPSLKITEK